MFRSSASPSPSQREANNQRQIEVLQDLGLLSSSRTRSKLSKSGHGRRGEGHAALHEASRYQPNLARVPSSLSHRSSTSEPGYSRGTQTSFNWRARGMAGMLDIERSRNRRERTFIGSECAVCEEPLEHTLRGEKVLQFSCGHVSHEACFYEYIREFESQYCPTCNSPLGLDTSRGGNVLDIEKLSSIVRSVSTNDTRHGPRSTQNTPTPWDTTSSLNTHVVSTTHEPTLRSQPRDRSERGSARQHGRNDSGATGVASADYTDVPPSATTRRHDYDVQSMETKLSSPRTSMVKNPIPPPTVTVRSEFPTLYRSRQQQSLTCLVTVEVMDNKWRPDPEDLRSGSGSNGIHEDEYVRPKSPAQSQRRTVDPYESPEVLEEVTEDLRLRVDNWHGLGFSRFGKLRLYGTIRVGKDRRSWQELECYLFGEMLICVKEKKTAPQTNQWDEKASQKMTRCTLKGSILIKKHLNAVESSPSEPILTLSLSVAELPSFHLFFQNRNQLELWKRALLDLNPVEPQNFSNQSYDQDTSETDDEDFRSPRTNERASSMTSSYAGAKSHNTAITDYTGSTKGAKGMDQYIKLPAAVHVPLDIVVVIPISSSMQGLKITLLRDTLKFLVQNLGERDRMGLVTFGSSGGGVPLVGMTSKAWSGWNKILNTIRPVGQKSLRADVVEGANVAMDLLMQRKSSNPVATILLISDSSTSDGDSVDFVVSRAEAAKTKAAYTYVKDWMMLRECIAGCLGSLQSTSHQNVKLKLKLPEGSPAKFVKISGALQVTKRATGRDAEAALGDLRFGDKRDILVQLVIPPDTVSQDNLPQDPWESLVSGLEALGGPLDQEEQRITSVEEVPLLQADLTYGDLLREGTVTHSSRPSLLAITMLPPNPKVKQLTRPVTPPIPPHPSIVQRRMELLTSDMLTRALTLVSRGQHDRAHHLLRETRGILQGLGKGGLPPVPPVAAKQTNGNADASTPTGRGSPDDSRSPSPPTDTPSTSLAAGIDITTANALDSELECALEWINHPAVFGRDSRKAVLQAIGVISSQRGFTFRTPSESLWADRISGVKKMGTRSRDWRETGDEALMEEP